MHAPIRVSAALQAIAGECALDISALFPFPHHGFLDLPIARMHLLGIALTSVSPECIEIPRLMAPKWADAASIICDPPPTGVEGILSRMPLPMLLHEQYRELWGLLQCSKAKQALQHAGDATPMLVSTLARLPVPLRTSRITRHLRHAREGEVLAKLFTTDADATRFAQSLSANETRESFFQKALEDLRRRHGFPALPPIHHDLVSPISNLADLRHAAIEFANCLRSFAEEIMSDGVGFYLWRGEEAAVVSVRPRLYGLIVDEIRGVRNEAISKATQTLIRSVFAAHGIGYAQGQAINQEAEQCLFALRCSEVSGTIEIERVCAEFLDQQEREPGCASRLTEP